MAVKLGTSSVTLKLGTQSVIGYLGSAVVAATVPGAPTINYAAAAGNDTDVSYSAPASNGGSAITSYKFYVDGLEATPSYEEAGFVVLAGVGAGAVVEVSAVNAVGEGPKSAPVTVT